MPVWRCLRAVVGEIGVISLHARAASQVPIHDPRPCLGSVEADAGHARATWTGPLSGPRGAHEPAQSLLQGRRRRLPWFCRVGLLQHHVQPERRHPGSSAASALCLLAATIPDFTPPCLAMPDISLSNALCQRNGDRPSWGDLCELRGRRGWRWVLSVLGRGRGEAAADGAGHHDGFHQQGSLPCSI